MVKAKKREKVEGLLPAILRPSVVLCEECTAVECQIKAAKGPQRDCRCYCTDKMTSEVWPNMKKIGDQDKEPVHD
ncbi:MAG: hypothetical protein WCK39_00165 [Methanomassiliicoccales archaeon]